MAWSSFIGPAVVAAVVSGIIAVIGMLVTRSTTLGIHREKIEADQLLARQKFDYDKQQAVFKRRFELAEQFLADTYRLKSLLDYVRNGAAFSDEGATREASESESESLKRRRDVYFVPAERLIKESDFLSSMSARRESCQAHFGPKAEEAYALMNGAVHKVRVASGLLVSWTNDRREVDTETMQKLEGDIWAGMAEIRGGDTIGADIKKAVALVEEICGPVLKWVG